MDWKTFLSKPVLMVAWGTKEEIASIRKGKEFQKVRQESLIWGK